MSLYIFGVAKNRFVVGTSYASVRKRIYIENRRLDFDDDGIICEYENYQYPPTTTTIPPTTTTIARTPPSGTWVRDNFQGSQKLLFFGYRYFLTICASSNSINTTTHLWAYGLDWSKKTESYRVIDKVQCADPNYPVEHGFYWVLDTLGAHISANKRSYSLQLKVTGFSSDVVTSRTVYLSEADYLVDFTNALRCALGEKTYC